MNTNETTTNHPQLIAASRLEKSPLNARHTPAKMGMDELRASLLAHGLMQNLVVTDAGDGTYLVIAGSRRLEAIRSLQAEGKLPQDYAVPCQIVAEDCGRELSLAENTVRLAMHPADEFEAFAALIDRGESAARVAERFGVEEAHVLRRMKLARVAPQLVQQYRDDEITLECLMAFTVTDDHRRQLKVFKSLADWQRSDPAAIRAALTEKLMEASSPLALFVGIDAYSAAGGSSRADLFGEEVYLEKPSLLHRLAEQKLAGIREDLQAEGWGWIEINPERDCELVYRCDRLQPRLVGAPAELIDYKSHLDAERDQIEQALEECETDALLAQLKLTQERLDEVDEKLAAFVGYEADHKPLAGCFVSIGRDGKLFIDKGLVRPEHRKQLTRLLGTDGGKPDRSKPKSALPESLRRDLAADRLEIARVEIAKHPAVAFDLLVFQAASGALGGERFLDGPAVTFARGRAKPGTGEPSAAATALAAIEQSLTTDWLKPKSEAARFEAFRALPQDAKLGLLAYCLALTLQPKLGPAKGDEPTAYDAALALTAADVASYWRPTSGNFLGRITRDPLLAVGSDVLGATWAQSHAKDAKAALVVQLDRAFADPDRSGRTPDQIERLKRWLPEGMAFGVAKMAKPAKGKKARRAA